MKEKKITKFIVPILLIVTFGAFTFLVTKIDVQPVGPENSKIGFATFNMAVHRLVGTHLVWYNITDWLGLVPVYFAFALGVLGFVQLVNRRSIFRIDKKLLLMGGFYILIIGLYVCFEKWIINYRPVVLGKNLEASYPSIELAGDNFQSLSLIS